MDNKARQNVLLGYEKNSTLILTSKLSSCENDNTIGMTLAWKVSVSVERDNATSSASLRRITVRRYSLSTLTTFLSRINNYCSDNFFFITIADAFLSRHVKKLRVSRLYTIIEEIRGGTITLNHSVYRDLSIAHDS